MTYVVYDMSSRLNARIDPSLARKVATLRRATKQTTTEVVRTALERYFEAITREASPYERLSESGFVGCADGPADLSATYKDQLARSLTTKGRSPQRRLKP
jgi:hypothetical protein